jgi:SpoVK/Ycf46/Vps4 family AAA+-type ATPase
LADDVDLSELTDRLAGWSGADIKNICRKAATIPFLASVRDGQERVVTRADLMSVIDKLRPSVNSKDLVRFERFREAGVA